MSKKKKCEWRFEPANEYQNTMFYTECGYSREVTNTNINEYDYKFCPFCAGEIVEVKNES